MVAFLPIVYLTYMFISLYMLFFFIIIFLKNLPTIYTYPSPQRHYSVSVLIPAYNEEDSIKETIESVLKSDYPLEEIIVINDGSKDKTRQIVEELAAKHSIIKLINKHNSGKADSLNQGIKVAKGELIAVIDSDSFPQSDAISKMIGYFDQKDIGAVTSSILVRNRSKFIEKLQAMEYAAIAFTRKLLEYIDGIWVTPGPLALYRKEALVKIGCFDTKNLTEDIEISWRLIHYGYKIRMSVPARVTTQAPSKWKIWAKQRIRWNVGGMQTLMKYKKEAFKKGLGAFVIPFFSITTFLGLFGLGVFTYLLSRDIYSRYFALKYSIESNVSPIVLETIYFTPTVLNMFGIALFVLGFYFTLFAFSQMKENEFYQKKNILILLFYIIVYMSIYPLLLLTAFYKIATGKVGWGTK
jgi:poly-beta-1,6 N-acetyl-D-glucosamine synthase